MKSGDDLSAQLRRIDGKGYKAYNDIQGSYNFRDYSLHLDHVQADPFAAPSRVRVQVDQRKAGFPASSYRSKSREIALRDYLTREFSQACRKYFRGNRGTGNSGVICIDLPGQEILERSSFFVTDSQVEARFTMGLPAYGRRIAGKQAESMFFEELPRIIYASLFFKDLDHEELVRHVETSEDADYLREKLAELGLVAFVAQGAVLPRESGIELRPLNKGRVVAFEPPESFNVEIELPNRGKITGMGIPRGVTLIVGGGYHGKSTLLHALELGVYNHVPGDGREFVITDPLAVKIRAEDGRSISKVDISPFITNLPFGKDTVGFSSEDASGSTSQAANTIEALEVGAQVLLIDEDTSATNFMIRDHRMQELVSKEQEPITPFIDKIQQLYKEKGVSTILVIGGSGDYFDVADHVICMVEYRPQDVTGRAREIAEKYRAERKAEGGEGFGDITARIPIADSLDPSRGRRPVKISAKGRETILFGRHLIELQAVEQLVDPSQTKAIGDAIHFAAKIMDGSRALAEIITEVLAEIAEGGLDVLNPRPMGDYAVFRGLELAAAINRLRSLRVKHV